jgi:hypothetical protein
MGHANKKKLLAALAGTGGAVIALTMLTPNLASAQSGEPGVGIYQAGSRLCGVYFLSKKSGEVLTRIYEVSKGDPCRDLGPGQSIAASPLSPKDKDVKNWSSSIFTRVTCESWKDRSANQGGLAGRDLNFLGEGWPAKDQKDICNNMARSENDSVYAYWLYDDNNPATKAVDFQRA